MQLTPTQCLCNAKINNMVVKPNDRGKIETAQFDSFHSISGHIMELKNWRFIKCRFYVCAKKNLQAEVCTVLV